MLWVCAGLNAQWTMRVDQGLAEERDVPIHYFSVLIRILYVCIHIVRKAKTRWYSSDTAVSAHCVIDRDHNKIYGISEDISGKKTRYSMLKMNRMAVKSVENRRAQTQEVRGICPTCTLCLL